MIVTQSGCTDTSACYGVNPTSLNNKSSEGNPIIYPNPTIGKLTIDLGKNPGFVTIKIFNVTGEVVRTVSNRNLEKADITLDEAPGMYFVQIQMEDGHFITKKILKE